MKISIKKAKDGQLYFVVSARNGKILVTSETYKSRQAAINAIKTLSRGINLATWEDKL